MHMKKMRGLVVVLIVVTLTAVLVACVWQRQVDGPEYPRQQRPLDCDVGDGLPSLLQLGPLSRK